MGRTIYLTDEELIFISAKANTVDSDDEEFNKRMWKLSEKTQT